LAWGSRGENNIPNALESKTLKRLPESTGAFFRGIFSCALQETSLPFKAGKTGIRCHLERNGKKSTFLSSGGGA